MNNDSSDIINELRRCLWGWECARDAAAEIERLCSILRNVGQLNESRCENVITQIGTANEAATEDAANAE